MLNEKIKAIVTYRMSDEELIRRKSLNKLNTCNHLIKYNIILNIKLVHIEIFYVCGFNFFVKNIFELTYLLKHAGLR